MKRSASFPASSRAPPILYISKNNSRKIYIICIRAIFVFIIYYYSLFFVNIFT